MNYKEVTEMLVSAILSNNDLLLHAFNYRENQA